MAQRPQPTFIPDSDIETSSQPESTEDTVVLQDTYEGDPRLSVLEAQVLGEWARLRGNLDTVRTSSGIPTPQYNHFSTSQGLNNTDANTDDMRR